MDAIQQDLDLEGLPVAVRIHGINAVGYETGNPDACNGRDLPWLQDIVEQSVWATWVPAYRDVVICDEANRVIRTYNLSTYNLQVPAYYEELKAILRGAAGG